MLGVGDAACRQVGLALFGAQVLQRQAAGERRPVEVGRQAGSRRIAPGDDDQRLGRELGEECLAQPGVERREHLVGVDQQDAAGWPGVDGGRCVVLDLDRVTDRPQNAGGRWVHVTAVDLDDGPAGFGGDAGVLTQQARLADPTGAVEMEDREGWWLLDQGGVEDAQFGMTADEASVPRGSQSIGEARWLSGQQCLRALIRLRHCRAANNPTIPPSPGPR